MLICCELQLSTRAVNSPYTSLHNGALSAGATRDTTGTAPLLFVARERTHPCSKHNTVLGENTSPEHALHFFFVREHIPAIRTPQIWGENILAARTTQIWERTHHRSTHKSDYAREHVPAARIRVIAEENTSPHHDNTDCGR